MTSTRAGTVEEGRGDVRGRPPGARPSRRWGRRLWSRPTVTGLAVLAAAAVSLSACGGGGPSASGVASLGTTTSSSPAVGVPSTAPPKGGSSVAVRHPNGVAFARCMRSHGLANFPDPTSSGGGFVFKVSGGIDPNSTQFKAAQHACRKYMPAGSTSAGGGPSKAVLLAYAKCMRAHGVTNFPDPVKFPGGSTSWGFDLVGQVTQTSPAIQEANQACRSSAYPGIRPCGGSGSAGSKERRC
jgi:hypothetical protein